ncbi:MAG: MBL fold metallo-hydrolase [Planctomycetes bacterium]|nr:MBL fold metallo-hydrolase [Planctomycetota bacterium]
MRPLAAACALALSAFAAAQRDFNAVQVTTTALGGSVHMLEGAGGNVAASVGPDGVLLVDSQFDGMRERLLAAVRELHDPAAPRFLLNTHWHGDHTGSNAGFARAAGGSPGAVIVAHANVRRRLAHDPDQQPAALPMVVYERAMSLFLNGEELRLEHIPTAHTDGDTVAWFMGSKVVHLGDLFFNGRFPVIDRNSGGDLAGLTAAIAHLCEKVPEEWAIIPGHGPPAKLEDLRAYHRMLVACTDIVRARLAEGQTREQVIAAGLPEEWASWGRTTISSERWLTSLVDNLQAPPPAGH